MWSQWNEYLDTPNFRIEEVNSLKNMYMSVWHEDFPDIQEEFDTSDTTIETDFRIAYTTLEGKVIVADEFKLILTDRVADVEEEEDPCLSAVISTDTVSRDLHLSFASDATAASGTDVQDFGINQSLKVKFADPENKECKVAYRLWVRNETSTEDPKPYVPWRDMVQWIKSE
jgi:hypothetical protein